MMKLKVNWKELGRQRGPLRALRALALLAAPLRNAARFFGASWAAVKPVLLAALGGGIVSVAAGCSSLVPTSKTQTLSVVGIGIPAIVITNS